MIKSLLKFWQAFHRSYMAFVDNTHSHYPEWLEEGNEYNIETGTNDYYKTWAQP